MRDAAIADALHESNKPLARYADDEDLEKMRREEMRDGDPMAAYIMRRKQKQQPSASGRFASVSSSKAVKRERFVVRFTVI